MVSGCILKKYLGGHGTVSMSANGSGTTRDLSLQEFGGNLGIGIGGPGYFIDAQRNTNAIAAFRLSNTDPGTSATSLLILQNGSTLGSGGQMLMLATGTNYASSGNAWRQNAGLVEAVNGLSGGLSIAAAGPNGEIRFYAGGDSSGALRFMIQSNGPAVFSYAVTAYQFIGDGSGLTNIPYSVLTGLPAAPTNWWHPPLTAFLLPNGAKPTFAPYAYGSGNITNFCLGMTNDWNTGAYTLPLPFALTNPAVNLRTTWLLPPYTTNGIVFGTISGNGDWTYNQFKLTNGTANTLCFSTNLNCVVNGSANNGVFPATVVLGPGIGNTFTNYLLGVEVRQPD